MRPRRITPLWGASLLALAIASGGCDGDVARLRPLTVDDRVAIIALGAAGALAPAGPATPPLTSQPDVPRSTGVFDPVSAPPSPDDPVAEAIVSSLTSDGTDQDATAAEADATSGEPNDLDAETESSPRLAHEGVDDWAGFWDEVAKAEAARSEPADIDMAADTDVETATEPATEEEEPIATLPDERPQPVTEPPLQDRVAALETRAEALREQIDRADVEREQAQQQAAFASFYNAVILRRLKLVQVNMLLQLGAGSAPVSGPQPAFGGLPNPAPANQPFGGTPGAPVNQPFGGTPGAPVNQPFGGTQR